jgi:hypothetical protein
MESRLGTASDRFPEPVSISLGRLVVPTALKDENNNALEAGGGAGRSNLTTSVVRVLAPTAS